MFTIGYVRSATIAYILVFLLFPGLPFPIPTLAPFEIMFSEKWKFENPHKYCRHRHYPHLTT